MSKWITAFIHWNNKVVIYVNNIKTTPVNKWNSKTRVTSSNPWITNLNSRVTSSNPRVRRLKTRFTRLKARDARLKPRVTRLKYELGD